MGKYFSLGEYNKRFKFLWLYLAFRAIYHLIFAERFVFEQLKPDLLLIPLSPFISYQFYYLTFIIISTILIFIDKSRKMKCCNKNAFIEKLIFNEPEQVVYSVKAGDYYLFINLFFVVATDLLLGFIYEFRCIMFSFWMFQMFFYEVLYSRILKSKMYKHHIFSMIFILFFCSLFKIIEIIMQFSAGTDDAKYFDDKKWLIPVGVIVYFLANIFSVFLSCYEKYYLESKIISITGYLLLYGIFGLILSSLCAILSSYIPCGDDNTISELFKNFCGYKDNKGNYYFDNYSIYFEELSSKDFALRIILLIIMYTLIYISYYYVYAIYKVLNPIYHYFVYRLNELIFTFLSLINFLINKEGLTGLDFALIIFDIFLLVFYLFGSMVYLEFIELNFCDLNKYTRRSIKARSNDDIKILLSDLRTESEIDIMDKNE